MDPPNFSTQPAAHGPECDGCTWMKVLDSTYTCSKYNNLVVHSNNLCDDYDSVYEQRGREILEKYRLKARTSGLC